MALTTIRDEHGFTLIELVVAIVILGIIIVPLTASIVVGLRTTTDAQQRLSESRSVLFTGAFFANDVQSADTVTLGNAPACGGAGTNIVTFAWADDVSPTNASSYVVVKVTSVVHQLVRFSCRGGALQTSSVIAPQLAAANPTAACTPNCTSPRQVVLNVTQPSGYAFTLNGTRRAT